MTKKIFGAIVLIVALAIVAGAFYIYEQFFAGNIQNPTAMLQQASPDFNAAFTDMNNGNYGTALSSYQKALVETQNPILSAQIEYYEAYTYQLAGQYDQAIDLFKNIAAGNEGWPIARAYAVQALGMMHYANLDNEAITQRIFSTAPYSSFGPSLTVATDVAYRNLFAYAASIYPLGISETRVAYWYANDLYTNLKSATTSPQGAQDIALINDSLVKADADIVRTQNDAASWQIPEIFAREGVVLGYMAMMGAADPAAAEAKFQQAIASANADNALPGSAVQFYYASFLANMYGAKRASDITNVLAPFTAADSSHIDPGMVTTFKDIRTDPSEAAIKANAVKLGQIDPSFKSYLISLGWADSDFGSGS